MYTDCPSCRRQFRVRAQHLSEAQGLARCGYCGEQFNLLTRLRDAPQPRAPAAQQSAQEPRAAAAASSQQAPLEEPQFHIPPAASAAARPERPRPMREVPFELLAEPEASPARSWIWGVAAVLLLLGAGAQAAWFNRDWLLRRFPVLRPAAQQLCERLPCEVVRHRDLGAISLINRDVRLHPVYQDTLLVNATMTNAAAFRQPFPQVQLVLFDTGGNAIAQRVFAPQEYLDESINVNPGMDPEVPVHFAIEISGAIENAVGFEFGFL